MSYQLNSNVYFCACGEDLVFLNLNTARYHMVSGSTADTVRRLIADPTLGNLALGELDTLVSAGLLLESESSAVNAFRTVEHHIPIASLFRGAPNPFRSADVLSATIEQVCAERVLRHSSLLTIVDRMKHQVGLMQSNGHTDVGSIAEDAATAFFYSRRLLPCHNKCLRTAIAMVNHLAKRGLKAQLVIGVKRGPFGVHAWAQNGSTVLSDTLDNVLPYAPIFVC